MKSSHRGAIALGLILAALLVAHFLPRSHFTGIARCAMEDKATLPSPDGAYQAVIYTGHCQPVDSTSAYVSIYPTGAKFRADIFPAVFAAEGADLPAVSWSGSRQVNIKRPAGRVIVQKNEAANGVAIAYP